MRDDRRWALWMGLAVPLAGCGATAARRPAREQLLAELKAAETAFADSMARRDLQAFASHVADDAVFINGGAPLRGKAAIVAHWRRFFVTPQAPFAWRPEIAEVAAGGDLGYTEGPVSSPAGVVMATFYSTWQRGSQGRWQVVFDNGYNRCAAQ